MNAVCRNNLFIRRGLISAATAILLGAGLLVSSTVSHAAEFKPPESVTIVTGGLKSTKYLGATALAGPISDSAGVRFKARPAANSKERVQVLAAKQADLLLDAAVTNVFATDGRDFFDSDGWGPQKLRTIWFVNKIFSGYNVKKSSGIKTWKDLEGKRIPRYVEFKALQTYMDAAKASFLQGVNFTEVDVASFQEGIKRLKEGSLDMAFNTTTTPLAYELEAHPDGIHWLALPHGDTENWNKYREVAPFFSPVLATYGAAVSEDNPLETVGFSDRWLAYDWQDEELVYWFAKQLDRVIPDVKDLHKYLSTWSKDTGVNIDEAISPYHPGAIRFFREAGLWTAEHDAWQAKMLAAEAEKIAAWKARHPDWKYNNHEG